MKCQDFARSLQGALRGVAAEAGLSSLIQTHDSFVELDAIQSSRISVFDELDSGVGAQIGDKIGASLRMLADKGKSTGTLCHASTAGRSIWRQTFAYQ